MIGRQPIAARDISARVDVHDLVVAFYREVVFDDVLAPVFGEIAEVDWVVHIPRLIDYWCRVSGTWATKERSSPHIAMSTTSTRFAANTSIAGTTCGPRASTAAGAVHPPSRRSTTRRESAPHSRANS